MIDINAKGAMHLEFKSKSFQQSKKNASIAERRSESQKTASKERRSRNRPRRPSGSANKILQEYIILEGNECLPAQMEESYTTIHQKHAGHVNIRNSSRNST